MNKKLVYRIAIFGIRSIPPRAGSAGADTSATEYYTRFVERGHKVTCYNRIYKDDTDLINEFKGIKLINMRTINIAGFDSLYHSFKATMHIIFFNTADIIEIGNGGNSIWALFLRMFGKKVFVFQDGVDWRRDKWPWYGKMFLYLSAYLTAKLPNRVIFDNIYAKDLFEKKFKKKFDLNTYGSEIRDFVESDEVCKRLNLIPGEYFLFVGRFIPDKGLHYLLPAFEKLKTDKKLVMVGGSPNPSEYELTLRSTKDPRIIFPGYIYGNDTLNLMKHAYLYIQPSDIEGLSPVILQVMGIGAPLLCSDIQENIFVVEDTTLTFKKSDIDSLNERLQYALEHPEELKKLALKANDLVNKNFSWDTVIDKHLELIANT